MSNTAFTLFETVKGQLGSGHLFVEIGSERGEGSTLYLQKLATETKNEFITVDIDPIYLGPKINAVTMSGEQWVSTALPLIKKKVSLAYLDGFDWINKPEAVRAGTAPADTYNLISEYSKKGLKLNNVESSLSCLRQVTGMLPHMADRCAIIFDDTWFDAKSDTFMGKGGSSVYFLLANGFELISAAPNLSFLMVGRNVKPINSIINLNFNCLSNKYTGPKKKFDEVIYVNV